MNAMSATASNAAAHPAMARAAQVAAAPALAIDCKVDKIFYGDFLAVRDSHVPIEKGKIIGFIGPSGCGKSTVLRSLNRMNDLIASSGSRATSSSSARTSTPARSTRSRSAVTSAWCSSSPTRSR